jgi:hypothetical protein
MAHLIVSERVFGWEVKFVPAVWIGWFIEEFWLEF